MTHPIDLAQVLESIQPTDQTVYHQAQARLDSLAKPPGSLGKLEEMSARLAGITGRLQNRLEKRCVVVMAADNGVVAEGVSSAPQEITALQTCSILQGVTGVGVLARQFNTDILVVDVGIASQVSHPKLLQRKIAPGTGNIARQPAMTHEQALQAIAVGVEMADYTREQGYQLLGAGEMGIGNTTTSSALLCALLGLSGQAAAQAVGHGAGLSSAGYAKKLEVMQTTLALHTPHCHNPLDMLARLGGYDLAAMAGFYLGCARNRLPVVVDGFISAVAALWAVTCKPEVKQYLFASHASAEPGYALAMQALGLQPCLQLDMRLGEGSGCPLLFALLDGACSIMNDMITLQEASISSEYLQAIPQMEAF